MVTRFVNDLTFVSLPEGAGPGRKAVGGSGPTHEMARMRVTWAGCKRQGVTLPPVEMGKVASRRKHWLSAA